MLNDFLVLQFIISITLLFFFKSLNVIIFWYLGGIYLILLGFLLLINYSDIWVGFLWVIDLGVGLIFFIFILHFSNFLNQKYLFDISSKFIFIFVFLLTSFSIFFYFFSNPLTINYNISLKKNWFFYVNWYDYYDFFFIKIISDLTLIKYIYFYFNSLVFFFINFFILYAIFVTINLTFFLKKLFNIMNYSQLINLKLNNKQNVNLLIRSQNFIKQTYTSNGSRLWIKKKKNKL